MSIEILTQYGQELAAHGYEVWLTKGGQHGGYLQYKDLTTGDQGSLQYSLMEGWGHSMPIVPSREYGSGMYIEDPEPPFTVEAARQCAQPTNYNRAVNARLANARDRTWRSASAIPLHAPEATPVQA
jgi:hypothetical protein